jgi:hypothetical protein
MPAILGNVASKFGRLTTVGNGVYEYYALPGVGDPPPEYYEQDTFPVTVTDGRGGEVTVNLVVKISE